MQMHVLFIKPDNLKHKHLLVLAVSLLYCLNPVIEHVYGCLLIKAMNLFKTKTTIIFTSVITAKT